MARKRSPSKNEQSGDPLVGGDVNERAAAARERAQEGSLEDLWMLLERGKADKSPSVRLAAAAAGADLAWSLRSTLGSAERAELVRVATSSDPAINPTLLMSLAAAGPEGQKRLGRILKDPRGDVRFAALMAIRRIAVSHDNLADTSLQKDVASWLFDKRMLEDTQAQLIDLYGEVGWPLPDPLPAGRLVLDAASRSRALEVRRRAPGARSGLWSTSGSDLAAPGSGTPQWVVVADDQVVGASRPQLLGPMPSEGSRLVFRKHTSEDDSQQMALQLPGTTWFKAEGKPLLAAILEHESALQEFPEACDALLLEIAALEGAVARRTQCILLLHAERLEECGEQLDRMLSVKKPRADLFWILARCRVKEGKLDAGREAVTAFLKRAKAKDPARPDAERFAVAVGAAAR